MEIIAKDDIHKMADSAVASDEIPAVYTDPLGLKKLANYLRSADGVMVRDGIEHDKRVQFFKGLFL